MSDPSAFYEQYSPDLSERHGFAVNQATMHGNGLSLEYSLRWPTAQVLAARLIGNGAEWPVDATVRRILTATVPHQGGHLVLRVDAVTGLPEDAPPLPWEAGIFLPPQAPLDYWAAETCDAVLHLPGGSSIQITRLLRGSKRTLLYADTHRSAGHHYIFVGLRAAGQLVPESLYPYRTPLSDRPALRDGRAGESGGPDQEVFVDVFSFEATSPEASLSLVIYEACWTMRFNEPLAVTIPPQRPAAAVLALPFQMGGLPCALREVWLGVTATALVLEVCGGKVHHTRFPTDITLTDDAGRCYKPTTPATRNGTYVFPPVPENVAHLTVSAEEIVLVARGDWEVPLTPGASATITLGDVPSG